MVNAKNPMLINPLILKNATFTFERSLADINDCSYISITAVNKVANHKKVPVPNIKHIINNNKTVKTWHNLEIISDLAIPILAGRL